MPTSINNLAINLSYSQTLQQSQVEQFETTLALLLEQALTELNLAKEGEGFIEHIQIELPDIDIVAFLQDHQHYFDHDILPQLKQSLRKEGHSAEASGQDNFNGDPNFALGSAASVQVSCDNLSPKKLLHKFLYEHSILSFDEFVQAFEYGFCSHNKHQLESILMTLSHPEIFRRFAKHFTSDLDDEAALRVLGALFDESIALQLLNWAKQGNALADLGWQLVPKILRQGAGRIDNSLWQLSVKVLCLVYQSGEQLTSGKWNILLEALSSIAAETKVQQNFWYREFNNWCLLQEVGGSQNKASTALLDIALKASASGLPSSNYTPQLAKEQATDQPVMRSVSAIKPQIQRLRREVEERLFLLRSLKQLCEARGIKDIEPLLANINALAMDRSLPKLWRQILAVSSTHRYSSNVALNLALPNLEQWLNQTRVDLPLLQSLTSMTTIPLSTLLEMHQLQALLSDDLGELSEQGITRLRDLVKKVCRVLSKKDLETSLDSDYWLPMKISFAAYMSLEENSLRPSDSSLASEKTQSRMAFALQALKVMGRLPNDVRFRLLNWLQDMDSKTRLHQLVIVLQKWGLQWQSLPNDITKNAKVAYTHKSQRLSSPMDNIEQQWMALISRLLQSHLDINSDVWRKLKHSLKNSFSHQQVSYTSIAEDPLGIVQHMVALALCVDQLLFQTPVKQMRGEDRSRLFTIKDLLEKSLQQFLSVLPKSTQQQLYLQSWWLRAASITPRLLCLEEHNTSGEVISSHEEWHSAVISIKKLGNFCHHWVERFDHSDAEQSVIRLEQKLQSQLGLLKAYLKTNEDHQEGISQISHFSLRVSSLLSLCAGKSESMTAPSQELLEELKTLVSLAKNLRIVPIKQNHAAHHSLRHNQGHHNQSSSRRFQSEPLFNALNTSVKNLENAQSSKAFIQVCWRAVLAIQAYLELITRKQENASKWELLESLLRRAIKCCTLKLESHQIPLLTRLEEVLNEIRTVNNKYYIPLAQACDALAIELLEAKSSASMADYGLEALDAITNSTDKKSALQLFNKQLFNENLCSPNLFNQSIQQAAFAKQAVINKSLKQLKALSFEDLEETLQGQLSHLKFISDTTPDKVWDVGILLYWPFLKSFFNKLSLLDDEQQWKDESAQTLAVELLLVFYGEQFPESPPVCCNLLTGRPIDAMPVFDVELSESQIEECSRLTQHMITQWKALKGMTPETFRELFIRREGHVEESSQGYKITVDTLAHDVLLTKLPWGLGLIKLPWLPDVMIDAQWSSGI